MSMVSLKVCRQILELMFPFEIVYINYHDELQYLSRELAELGKFLEIKLRFWFINN